MSGPAEPRGRAALPPLSAEAADAALSPPALPAAALPAVALARAAAVLALPVRLEAPQAARRVLLARALHAASGRRGPLLAADGRGRALTGLPGGATVLIDLETLTAPAAAVVEALLDDGDAWLLLAAPPGRPLPPALAVRLDPLTLRVPSLAERTDDLPALAARTLERLAARAGRSAPALTPDALAWLAAQPWPGDVGELEARLGVALLRAAGAAIGTAELDAAAAGAAPRPAHDAGDAQLEYLVAELAHELRNPLAGVKAFVQLPGLADDPALRTRFGALAEEAAARMDDLLDDVAAFARLGPPVRTEVELGGLLDGVVAELRPAFAERGIRLDYAGPNGARCRADGTRLRYALRHVLAAVARAAPERDVVRLDAAAPGVVRVEFDHARGSAGQLRRLVAADAPGALPLGFVLARAVLGRDGGGLAMAGRPDGRAVVEVRLPGAPGGG